MVRLTRFSFQQRPDKTVVRKERAERPSVPGRFLPGASVPSLNLRRNRGPGQTSNGFFALTDPAHARIPRERARDGVAARGRYMARW